MIKYCIKQWDKYKDSLKEAIETDSHINSCDYTYLVELVVEYILNGDGEKGLYKWDKDHITCVDDGGFQGTQLFLIPRDTYQPSAEEYLMTYQYYGSCSGCDTLLAIQESVYAKLPTTQQIEDYMTLCKDLICCMIRPYQGCYIDNDFATITIENNS